MTNVTTTTLTSLSTSLSTSSATEGNVVIEAVVLCLIIFVSVVGNLSLWIVVLRSRSLRTVTNMFILGLSAADLFVATVNMPVTVYVIIKGYWNLSETACVVTGFTNMLTLCTSVLSLCNISINRYIMVVKPGKFREIYTKGKAIVMITSVVMLAAFLSTLPLIGWAEYKFIPTHSFCFADWANHMSYAFFMIGCCFCIPCVVMTVCNILIFRAVRKSRQKVKIAISPASVLDKSRHSANLSEISTVPDIPTQELNCSSTDEDGTVIADSVLDKISIDSTKYKEIGQTDVSSADGSPYKSDTTDKYRQSVNHSPMLKHNNTIGTITEDFEDARRINSAKISNTPPRLISVDNTGAMDLNRSIDEDCMSTASSTETSSLRAYNPMFDRKEMSRSKPSSRGPKQQYLTIPKDARYLKEQKHLHKTTSSQSNLSLHSSDSDSSLKLKPIKLSFAETNDIKQAENNNVLLDKSDIRESYTEHLVNSNKSQSILSKNGPVLKTNEKPSKTDSEQNRKVSINEDRSQSKELSNDPDPSIKNKRSSIFHSRKHGSPPPKRREEIVLARSLAVVVILFVLCWLPYCISMLLSIFYTGTVPRGFHMFTLIIGYANSGCNPIVYGAMNKRFAVGYKNLFCFWKDHRLTSFNSSSL